MQRQKKLTQCRQLSGVTRQSDYYLTHARSHISQAMWKPWTAVFASSAWRNLLTPCGHISLQRLEINLLGSKISYFKMIDLISMAALNRTELREATKSMFVNLFLNSVDLPAVALLQKKNLILIRKMNFLLLSLRRFLHYVSNYFEFPV